MSGRSGRQAAHDPAPVFAALGDPTRLKLVGRLCDGRPRSIAELTSSVELTRQAVTKHLRVLETAGLVRARQVGRESRFSLVPAGIREARAYLETISRQWDDALARLKSFVDS